MCTDGRCNLSPRAVTHSVLCQRGFALIPLFSLSLREAGRELLLRAVALFAQEHQEKGQSAEHLSLSADFQELQWGFPWGSRQDLQECSPRLGCTAAAVAFLGLWFPVEHHLPKVSVPCSLQREFTAAMELPWAQHQSVLTRTEWRCGIANNLNCSKTWVWGTHGRIWSYLSPPLWWGS